MNDSVSGKLDSLVPDPTLDAAGIIGTECFLCGKPITALAVATWFGRATALMPQLPCHKDCLNGRPVQDVAREYHRRLSDLVGARRPQ